MELPHRYDVSRDMPGHAMAPAAARARSEGSATSDGLKGAISVGRNLRAGTAALVSCTEPYGSLTPVSASYEPTTTIGWEATRPSKKGL